MTAGLTLYSILRTVHTAVENFHCEQFAMSNTMPNLLSWNLIFSGAVRHRQQD